MTASLAFRKNEASIFRGDVPEKYTRLLSHIPGNRIIEIGSAEGVLALLLAKQGKFVTAVEKSQERHETAQDLRDAWDLIGVRFINGSIADNLCLLPGHDTLLCVRSIYYLGEDLDKVFAEASKHIKSIVLCGNKNRASRWRAGTPDEPLGDMNRYAAREGMVELLERHGYRIVTVVESGDEIVAGHKA